MLNNILKLKICVAIIILVISTGCKREYIDPNRVSDKDALTTDRGLTATAIGLQRTYTIGRGSPVYNSFSINGLVTNELIVMNTGNAAEVLLQAGGSNVDLANPMLRSHWSENNLMINTANLVINNAYNLGDKTYTAGIVAYASIFKALCIGNLAMYWEKIPDTIGINVNFISRIDGFKKAVQILDNAIYYVNTYSINPIFSRSLPSNENGLDGKPIPAINIKNTLFALKARYALFAGDYAIAKAAADSVDLTKKSAFIFETATANPIYATATATNNVVQTVDSTFGLPIGLRPATNDGRISFYTTIATSGQRFRIKGFGATVTTAIPVYLPGEITLIKAEVYARQNNLANAIVELNKVVTKTPAMDAFGIGANQPSLPNTLTQAQILEEIYRNRCIELYMSGLKLEDMRADRFNRDTSERKRNFMPYPFTESDNNSNTPANPAF